MTRSPLMAGPMLDEDPFIPAIREAPQNETIRLVYADWLEDHGEGEKSEYLRLVHHLSNMPEATPECGPLVQRLLEVAANLEEDWREQVAPKFDVIVEGWLGGAMNVFLRALRWLGGQHALSAIQSNDQARTITIRGRVRREQAEELLFQLDHQRYRGDRVAKSIYRIVLSSSNGLIPVENQPA